jgi:hypothetical protein
LFPKRSLHGSDPGVVANVWQSFGPGIGSLSFAGCLGAGGSMELSASANTTYYIQAGSVSIGSARLQLDVAEVPRPANDDFANATQISSLPFSDTADRTGAGLENGEPTFPSCGSISHTIWHAFTPTKDETLYAHGSASGVNSVIAVYTGSSLAGLTEVGCRFERDVFRATAGTTYWIQVGSWTVNREPSSASRWRSHRIRR